MFACGAASAFDHGANKELNFYRTRTRPGIKKHRQHRQHRTAPRQIRKRTQHESHQNQNLVLVAFRGYNGSAACGPIPLHVPCRFVHLCLSLCACISLPWYRDIPATSQALAFPPLSALNRHHLPLVSLYAAAQRAGTPFVD